MVYARREKIKKFCAKSARPRPAYVGIIEKEEGLGGPTVKQFYNKAQKGRDFLVPFAHDLACKV